MLIRIGAVIGAIGMVAGGDSDVPTREKPALRSSPPAIEQVLAPTPTEASLAPRLEARVELPASPACAPEPGARAG